MTKDDFPPLIPPGVHQMTLGDLRDTAARIANDQHRTALQDGMDAFAAALQAVLPSFEFYIDGSYLTTKTHPGDMDVVLFISRQHINAMSNADYEELQRLRDRDFARAQYGLDIYVEPLGDMHRRAYWRGLFGFAHDEVTSKGMVWIKLDA